MLEERLSILVLLGARVVRELYKSKSDTELHQIRR